MVSGESCPQLKCCTIPHSILEISRRLNVNIFCLADTAGTPQRKRSAIVLRKRHNGKPRWWRHAREECNLGHCFGVSFVHNPLSNLRPRKSLPPKVNGKAPLGSNLCVDLSSPRCRKRTTRIQELFQDIAVITVGAPSRKQFRVHVRILWNQYTQVNIPSSKMNTYSIVTRQGICRCYRQRLCQRYPLYR